MAKVKKPSDPIPVTFVIGGQGASGGISGEYFQELSIRGEDEPPTGRYSITIHGGNTLGGK
jgi:hypothetical protein